MSKIICNPNVAETSLKKWGTSNVRNYVQEAKEYTPALNGFMTRDGRIADFEELHEDVADDVIRQQNPDLNIVATSRLVECGFPRISVGHEFYPRTKNLQANIEVASNLTAAQKQSIRMMANLVNYFYFDIRCKDKNKENIDTSGKGIEDFFEKFRMCQFDD